jgi:ribosomal-protein-alanine N-acetyltransferase
VTVPDTIVRLVRPDDAEPLVRALAASREHLAEAFPGGWDERLDPEHQRRRIEKALDDAGAGRSWPGVIIDAATDAVVGRVALHDVVRGNRLCCFVSYWLAASATGSGHATRAVGRILDVAFGELGLHRVDAFVRPANTPSLRVLERAGFDRIGVARRHTFVGTDWQDEVLLQRLAPWDAPGLLEPAEAGGQGLS